MARRIGFAFAAIAVIASIFVTGSCSSMRSRISKEPFAIGFDQWVGFAPFYLAKEKGYFGNLPVSLKFIELEGDRRAGLSSGKLQMICETMDMFQTNREMPDYPGKIVFAVDESLGGDGIIATADITSLKDLKGKTVVAEPGLPAHFVLQYLLHKEGMTLNDITIHNMTSADAASAFIAGKADVAGTYEPYLTEALKKRQGAHLLVSTKNLPGLVVDVAIVTQETLRKRSPDVQQVFIGWCKALQELRSNPSEAETIMAKALKMERAEFNETLSGLRYIDYTENQKRFGTNENPGPIVTTFDLAGQILLKNKLTSNVAPGKQKIIFSVTATPLK